MNVKSECSLNAKCLALAFGPALQELHINTMGEAGEVPWLPWPPKMPKSSKILSAELKDQSMPQMRVALRVHQQNFLYVKNPPNSCLRNFMHF